jgi:hypothetical protein
MRSASLLRAGTLAIASFIALPAHANLVATWDARDFRSGANGNGTLSDGATVSTWVATGGSTVSNQSTTPVYELGLTPAGTDAVTFQPADNDILRYSAGAVPISGKTAFSVVFVFKANAVGSGTSGQWYTFSGIVDAEQGGPQNDWGCTFDDSGQVNFGIGNTDTTIRSTGNLVTSGDWHVVVATWDNAVSGSNNQFLYLDGTLVAQVDGPNSGARNLADFGFGRQPSGQGGTANIALAEVRMYDHALSALEVGSVTTALTTTHIVPAPDASVTPSSIDFGGVPVGDTSSGQTITVANDGSSNLVVSSIATVGGHSTDFALTRGTCPNLTPTLSGGSSCTIIARFSPAASGVRSTAARITSNDASSPHDVTLTGTGTLAPVADITTSLVFGVVAPNQTSSAQAITIANDGNDDLVVSSIAKAGAQSADFALSLGTCASFTPTITAGSSCTVTATFSPSAAGLRTTSVQIASNDANSPHSVTLSGAGGSSIPTLSEWGFIAFAAALVATMARALRRRDRRLG